MKIAIVGSGISGLTAAYRLHRNHDVTVFEAADRIGGHTSTVDVQLGGRSYQVDTGFIVFNDWTYPNFIALMDEIGVKSRATDMSFGIRCEVSGLEYAGVDGNLRMINSLFAQRRNLFSPWYLRLLLDILRFNQQATADVEKQQVDPGATLQSYVQQYGLSAQFMEYYLVPMCSAIWSTSFQAMLDFPMRFMLPFMYHHGLLSVNQRPRWRTIQGGSSAYVQPLCAGFRNRIRLHTPVLEVRRCTDGVEIDTRSGTTLFDQVILACHSDQALQLLADPSQAEREVLGAIGYQANDVVLHTDASLMPRSRHAWASWNYRLTAQRDELPKITYDMNRLMGLGPEMQFCVTLNDTQRIDPAHVIRRFSYAHPVFTLPGVEAQQRWADINGVQGTWYCGAYWGKGFHEDGVNSAERVATALLEVKEADGPAGTLLRSA